MMKPLSNRKFAPFPAMFPNYIEMYNVNQKIIRSTRRIDQKSFQKRGHTWTPELDFW